MTHVKAFFEQIHSVIAKHLTEARTSIQVATAWIGDDELIERLAEKARQGVAVDLIVSGDSFNEASESKLDILQHAGANVMVWGDRRNRDADAPERNYASLMHHKFCVIDGKTLINGSLNWTYKARGNRENIIVTNHLEAARRFTDQFWLLRRDSRNWFSNEPTRFNATFTANRYRVAADSTIKLNWEVAGADEVTLNGKPVLNDGFATFQVGTTTTFSLEMSGEGDTTVRALTIEVLALPSVELKSSADAIVHGDMITLDWRSTGADKVRLLPGNLELAASGSIALSPEKHTVYTLEAINEAGTTTTNCQVRVFPVPQIKALNIPIPVELRTSLTLEFQEFTAPAAIRSGIITNGISLRFPRIRSISAILTGRLPVTTPATPRKHLFNAFTDLKNSVRGINFGNL